jgi:hypothetical protein
MCACINHEQVQMDCIFFVPPFPFFEGTRAEFANPALDDCWYGRVVLLCSIRVKLDKKDQQGRQQTSRVVQQGRQQISRCAATASRLVGEMIVDFIDVVH